MESFVLHRKFINVGKIYIAREPTEIVTILGSCVAVCLFDKIQGIAGVNHYRLPMWTGHGIKGLCYGDISIPKLIEGMEEAGCAIRNIEAKIFGGARINMSTNEAMMIGKKNALIAQEILKKMKISILTEDIGGDSGRHLTFNSKTGEETLRYLNGSI